MCLQSPGGVRRRSHVFRIVLSHSRKGYSEAVGSQTTDAFLQCLENAFVHFGGVPATLVLDNLKAAVARADWFDPELQPKVRSFADDYGVAFLPTRPYTPRQKGKIENGIAYVKDNALKGRFFANLEERNRHLLAWETTAAWATIQEQREIWDFWVSSRRRTLSFEGLAPMTCAPAAGRRRKWLEPWPGAICHYFTGRDVRFVVWNKSATSCIDNLRSA
jgi:transposase